jgi:hypothetical protein
MSTPGDDFAAGGAGNGAGAAAGTGTGAGTAAFIPIDAGGGLSAAFGGGATT